MIAKRKGIPVTEGLKEAWSKRTADGQETDMRHTVSERVGK